MPWQRHVLDVALEIDPATGRFAYREVILTVPRQSGKTTLLLVLILLRAIAEPRQQIRYTAQTGADARKKWMDDWLPVLKPSSFARLFKVRLTNGHEALLFHNGSHQGLVATTRKTGHGGSLDLAIVDEAFAQPDARLEQALKPAMVTRTHPQFWIVSTAGTAEDSPYLWQKVEAGRQLVDGGVTEGVAYFEWSADEDADPSDHATWFSCMPALGRTASIEAVQSDFSSMSLSEFRRAYLNQWVASTHDPAIPLDTWAGLVDHDSTAENPVTFAFDVTPDRSRSAISAAGRRSDGLWHIEVVDHRSGTGWLAGRLRELVASHRPSGVWCDPAGPAGSVLPELAALGVEAKTVTSKEHAQACGILFDAATEPLPGSDRGRLRHLGTPELTAALDGATKRPLGDSWLWSRKSSSVDIAPLVSSTLALWGLQQGHKRASGVRVIDLAAALAADAAA